MVLFRFGLNTRNPDHFTVQAVQGVINAIEGFIRSPSVISRRPSNIAERLPQLRRFKSALVGLENPETRRETQFSLALENARAHATATASRCSSGIAGQRTRCIANNNLRDKLQEQFDQFQRDKRDLQTFRSQVVLVEVDL